ncbi:MAG: DUF975 family protein [Clostridiales bacterium]|nr:DUF975 family protein [Clostridiales bacterium]
MWRIGKLKKNARRVLKGHYFGIIVTCIIMMAVMGTLDTFEKSTIKNIGHYMNQMGDGFFFDDETPLNDVQSAVDTDIKDKGSSEIVEDFMEEAGVEEVSTQKWTKGVLAVFANNAEGAGNMVYGILNALNQLIFKDKIGAGIIILVGVIVYAAVWILFINTLLVGFYRYLLECRVYKNTRMNRILFPWSVKHGGNVVRIMLLRSVYTFLWSLTIVGGIIKSYSYRLVPIIVAENPQISAKEAILLSRKMMDGNKFKAFLLDISFIGWAILDACTLGLLGKLFIDPYKYLTNMELYMELRKKAKAEGMAGADKLCDTLLEGEPCEGQYPINEYFIPTPDAKRWIQTDYNCSYSITTLILIFFTFSCVGWLWEVSLHLFKDGAFVNRGVSYGPWLPIYGAGGVLVLVVLKKLRDKPVLTFLATMVLCGFVEYFTSLFLEMTKGMKWWDYSGYFMNLNGRICLEGLLVFAIGGCAAIYMIGPALNGLFEKIPKKYKIIICTVLITVFVADQTYSHFVPNSGKGITDYN